MSALWAVPMLISAGLFAGVVVSIALERLPAWREADLPDFQAAFGHTLRRVDRLQPALLAVCLVSTTGFAVTARGAARMFALLGTAGFFVFFVGSGAWLVPVQRRLAASGSAQPSPELERLRRRWFRGHLIRTVVALAALSLAVVAAVL